MVDRSRFRLRVWKMSGNEYVREFAFDVAVGAVGHTTPAGLYTVNSKSRTPDWLAPNAEWVPEELRGQVLPFEDPHNPFAGGFIGFGHEGVGFHGTKFDPQIGTRASHGCIRMRVEDIEKMYDRIAYNTPVFVY